MKENRFPGYVLEMVVNEAWFVVKPPNVTICQITRQIETAPLLEPKLLTFGIMG